MTHQTEQRRKVLRLDRARSRPSDPLDGLLTRAAQQAQDPVIKRWFLGLLAGDERDGGRSDTKHVRQQAAKVTDN